MFNSYGDVPGHYLTPLSEVVDLTLWQHLIVVTISKDTAARFFFFSSRFTQLFLASARASFRAPLKFPTPIAVERP